MDIEKAIVVLSNMISDGIIMTEDETEAIEIAVFFLPKLLKYRQIGTIDECRAAREKQIPQKPELIEVKTQGLVGDGTHTDKVSYQSDAYECPKCGSFLGFKTDCCDDEHYQDSFCPDCGQALKWGD